MCQRLTDNIYASTRCGTARCGALRCSVLQWVRAWRGIVCCAERHNAPRLQTWMTEGNRRPSYVDKERQVSFTPIPKLFLKRLSREQKNRVLLEYTVSLNIFHPLQSERGTTPISSIISSQINILSAQIRANILNPSYLETCWILHHTNKHHDIARALVPDTTSCRAHFRRKYTAHPHAYTYIHTHTHTHLQMYMYIRKLVLDIDDRRAQQENTARTLFTNITYE